MRPITELPAPDLRTVAAPSDDATQGTENSRQGFEVWADRELARVQQQLGDRWQVWYIWMPFHPAGHSWSAMPTGASVATCIAFDSGPLIQQVGDYTAALPEHIAKTRADLEAAEWPTQRDMLQKLLDALLSLRESMGDLEARYPE
jgi:hypothetical protein